MMLRTLVLLLAAALLSACHSTPASDPSADPAPTSLSASPSPVPSPVPADFWLSVTVMGPLRTPAAYELMPRTLRPGRYIVEADRILRAALGAAASDDSFPPGTRVLSSAQQAQLWLALHSSGLAAADHPNIARLAPAAEAIASQTLYIIQYQANHQRRMLVLRAEPDADPLAPQAAALVDLLAELAWLKNPPVSPQSAANTTTAPSSPN